MVDPTVYRNFSPDTNSSFRTKVPKHQRPANIFEETHLEAFWLSLFTIFIAEMGDKTQLVAMCLASRFNARVVLAGIFSATLLVHIFSVVLGLGVGKLIPAVWIGFVAGLAFIGFGLWTLRGDELSDEECANIQGKSAFWLVSSTFFLAELGDKTMISTATLATQYSIIPVWLGSTLGMVVADGLAIVVGQIMGKKLPERAIKIGASVIFFGFGSFKVIGSAMGLPHFAWAIATAVLGGLAFFFLRGSHKNSVDVPKVEREAAASGKD